ncbi:MAG: tetratricopeptide repeat protein [Caldilineaceae bacterium]
MVFQQIGYIGQAEGNFKEGLEIAQQMNNAEYISKLAGSLAGLELRRHDLEQTDKYAHASIEAAQTLQTGQLQDELVVKGSITLGLTSMYRGNLEQAATNLEKSLHIARHLEQRDLLSMVLINLGTVTSLQNKFAQAVGYFEEALALSREIQMQEHTVGLLANLCKVATLQQNFTQAEGYLAEGLTIARKIEHPLVLCNILSIGAELYINQGKWKSGADFFDESIEIGRKINSPDVILNSLNGLIDVAVNYDPTVISGPISDYHQEALALAKQLDEPLLLIHTLCVGGEAYLHNNEVTAAEDSFSQALTMTEKVDSPEWAAAVHFGVARVNALNGNFEQARMHAENSLAIFERIGHVKASKVKSWLEEFAHQES